MEYLTIILTIVIGCAFGWSVHAHRRLARRVVELEARASGIAKSVAHFSREAASRDGPRGRQRDLSRRVAELLAGGAWPKGQAPRSHAPTPGGAIPATKVPEGAIELTIPPTVGEPGDRLLGARQDQPVHDVQPAARSESAIGPGPKD